MEPGQTQTMKLWIPHFKLLDHTHLSSQKLLVTGFFFFLHRILVEWGYLGLRCSSKYLKARDFLIKFRCNVSISRWENDTIKNTIVVLNVQNYFSCAWKINWAKISIHRRGSTFCLVFFLFIFFIPWLKKVFICVCRCLGWRCGMENLLH